MHEGNLIFTFIRQGKRTTFNVKGEEVPAPEVKQPVRGPDALSCGHGLKVVERNGLWGVVDADGSEIVPALFRAIDCFRFGVAWAPVEEKREWFR